MMLSEIESTSVRLTWLLAEAVVAVKAGAILIYRARWKSDTPAVQQTTLLG